MHWIAQGSDSWDGSSIADTVSFATAMGKTGDVISDNFLLLGKYQNNNFYGLDTKIIQSVDIKSDDGSPNNGFVKLGTYGVGGYDWSASAAYPASTPKPTLIVRLDRS